MAYAGGGTIGIVRGVRVAQGKVFASMTGGASSRSIGDGQPAMDVTLDNAAFPGGTIPHLPFYDGLLYVGTAAETGPIAAAHTQ